MTKAKGRFRQEAGVKKMEGQPIGDEPPPSPKREEAVETSEVVIGLGEDGEDRLIQRLVFGSRHQLIDFCLQQEILYNGKWAPVIRYDCAHGSVHADVFERGAEEPRKKPVSSLADIDHGYEIAEESIYGGWQEHRRRYLNG